MEPKNFNETVAELAKKSTQPKIIHAELPDGNIRAILMSTKGMQVHDLDSYMQNPLRIEATESLNKPEGFIDYVNKFKGEHSCIFGTPQSSTPLVAELDYHGIDTPSWREHKCKMVFAPTIPWSKWTRAEDQPMSHRELINFIRDNIEDIESPEHAKLLESIMQFDSALKVNSKSRVEGHGEKRDISSEFKTSDIPEIIEAGLAPYRYVKHYKAIIRLSLRETEKGPRFSFVITNRERILEAVFDDLVKLVEEKTDLKVYV